MQGPPQHPHGWGWSAVPRLGRATVVLRTDRASPFLRAIRGNSPEWLSGAVLCAVCCATVACLVFLCYAVLCCACAVLCCAMVCRAVLCCPVCCAMRLPSVCCAVLVSLEAWLEVQAQRVREGSHLRLICWWLLVRRGPATRCIHLATAVERRGSGSDRSGQRRRG